MDSQLQAILTRRRQSVESNVINKATNDEGARRERSGVDGLMEPGVDRTSVVQARLDSRETDSSWASSEDVSSREDSSSEDEEDASSTTCDLAEPHGIPKVCAGAAPVFTDKAISEVFRQSASASKSILPDAEPLPPEGREAPHPPKSDGAPLPAPTTHLREARTINSHSWHANSPVAAMQNCLKTETQNTESLVDSTAAPTDLNYDPPSRCGAAAASLRKNLDQNQSEREETGLSCQTADQSQGHPPEPAAASLKAKLDISSLPESQQKSVAGLRRT